MRKTLPICLILLLMNGCSLFTRLADIGREPELSKIENPQKSEDYRPVEMPMPEAKVTEVGVNSLWRGGARGFYKDQRASQTGDILTVLVSIKDGANMQNNSQRSRGGDSDSLSLGALAGFENKITEMLPTGANSAGLLDITSSSKNVGAGSIKRDEAINLTLAATVTQVLPNGNLVITGVQEVRVNYELRQLKIDGIVRRSDINSNNTVSSDKIAELRVAYGGKGTISDVQQPRYGRQILEVINPF